MVDRSISETSLKEVWQRFLPDTKIGSMVPKWVDSMAGIPGAGKTTYVESMLANGSFSREAFLLSPDAVMESLPEYVDDYRRIGPVGAFQRWEEPSVRLAYEMLATARQRGLNLIIDMGLARPESLKLLQDLKHRDGYRVRIHWLEPPVELALERIKHRVRHTPVSMVIERSRALEQLKALYIALADEFLEVPYTTQLDDRIDS